MMVGWTYRLECIERIVNRGRIQNGKAGKIRFVWTYYFFFSCIGSTFCYANHLARLHLLIRHIGVLTNIHKEEYVGSKTAFRCQFVHSLTYDAYF